MRDNVWRVEIVGAVDVGGEDDGDGDARDGDAEAAMRAVGSEPRASGIAFAVAVGIDDFAGFEAVVAVVGLDTVVVVVVV